VPIVPLGIGSYKRSDGLVPEVVLRNLYLEQDKSGISPDKTLRVQRPGLVTNYDYNGPIRAVHYRTATSELLVISGGSLFSGQVPVAGAVSGTTAVPIVSTQFVTALIANGLVMLYDQDLTRVAMPMDSPRDGFVVDTDQLNNYVLLLQNTGRFYWIVPGDKTVDPLNFATAESLPDAGIALRRLGDEFWIFGAENIEVWQPTGDQDLPFARAAGRNFERGCLYRDTVRRFDNTLVWVGDDYQVYRASNVPQVISDNGISERIRKASSDCSAWTFSIDGHNFYVLRIPGQGTFAYDASTQAWSEFASNGRNDWLPWVGAQVSGVTYAGSSIDGRVWRISGDAVNDAGEAIECIVTATVPILGKPPRNDSVSVGVGVSQDCDIRLRWKDGQDGFPDYYEPVEVRAPFDVGTLWRLGQPDQPYRTLEVSKVDPSVRIRIAGLVVNESWQ
jgi:hypothetical protein